MNLSAMINARWKTRHLRKSPRRKLRFFERLEDRRLLAAGPAVDSWLLNTTGTDGTSPNPHVDFVVSQLNAEIQQIRHNDDNVYINATGIPSYSIGDWTDGNPAVATDRDYVVQIPKVPAEEDGPKAPTPLGDIGLWVNGVAIYNAWDGACFKGDCVNWQQDATRFELDGQDDANGHPAEVPNADQFTVTVGTVERDFTEGEYHHHFDPTELRNQLRDDGMSHSPILGFAYDGFPIYGPWGFANTDGTGGVTRMRSSYQIREDIVNLRSPDSAPPLDMFPKGDFVHVGRLGSA